MMKRVSLQSVRVLSALALVLGGLGVGAHAQVLRVCADPNNLPFSKAEGPERGLYVELAEAVAKRLQRPVEYVWYDSSYQRRALRNTILANECDAYFALPADADYRARGLQKSVGFLNVGYVVVAAPGFAFSGLEDLKGKRVAVLFGSTPAVLLSSIEGVTLITKLKVPEALDALQHGEADVAFVWGPSAGYEIQRHHANERWQATPVTGHGLGGPVSVAVRRDQPELVKAIDQALRAMQPDIDALAVKYGFPRGKPIELERTSARTLPLMLAQRHSDGASWVWRGAGPALLAVADAPSAGTQKPASPTKKAATKPVAVQPAASAAPATTVALDPAAAAGRQKFNDICSHCHSPDGASPMRERDLRRLKMRYDDKWVETAVKTINEGRVPLGMPTWKGQLKDDEIDRIVSFLKTIQK